MSIMLLRIACLGYCVLLSWLLTTRNPTSLVVPGSFLEMLLGCVGWLSHFVSFLLLTLLALTARWTMPLRTLVTCLVAYAVAMEGLQWFVPSRCVELQDVVQNLVGIGVGCVIWLGAKRGRGKEVRTKD